MKIINDLDLRKQAKELGVSVWQTPSFLFFMMGVIAMVAMAATYYISKNYDNPQILIIAECTVVAAIFIIGNFIIREMEQFARLNKLKSEFVFVASHQLRTPLSAISWETELLLFKLGDGLNPRQKETIESVSQLARRMTRLVSDLLDVARIDQGRLVLKKERIDLAQLVRETIREILPLAQARNVVMTFDSSDPVWVAGDAEKLRLVVDNLLSNAVKYTINKGKAEIKLERKEAFVFFSVKDEGVGIPAGQQKQVFEKFFRSDNVVKYQTEGTGLGLYIAKNIIDQLGGKLWFESGENKGSTFHFSVPVFQPA